MTTPYCLRRAGPMLLALALLSACATLPPTDAQATPVAAKRVERVEHLVKVDESSMLPLLGYLQQLTRMSAAELARERQMLTAIAQTPATRVRLAMLLGQARGATDLPRALALLDKVQKSADPVAASMHPLARALSAEYQERQRLAAQNDKLQQQLGESLQRNSQLQDKLDALADLERSLAVRPSGENPPAGLR